MTDKLAVRKEDTEIFKSMMREFDMGGLAAKVENLTDANLRDTEKDHAVLIINDWNENVISKINQRASNMREVIDHFEEKRDHFSYYSSYGDNRRLSELNSEISSYDADLADKTGTLELYGRIDTLKEKVENIISCYPTEPVIPKGEDPETAMNRRHTYEREKFQAEKVIKQAINELNIAYSTWLKTVREIDAIKEMIAQAKSYLRKVNTFKSECDDLTLMARTNVLLSDGKAKEILKDMMNFGKKI